MERTKKPNQRGEINPMFEVARTKRATQAGLQTFREDIEGFMMPKLKEYGFESRIVTAEEVNAKLKIKDYELYKKEEGGSYREMLFHKNSGFLLDVWRKGCSRTVMPIRPTVIEGAKSQYTKNHPRVNLSKAAAEWLMKEEKKEAKLKVVLFGLFAVDLHFLIMTKTGQFWLADYASITNENWMLTYRKDPNLLNRIQVKAGYQDGRFHSMERRLEIELTQEIYSFTSNNNYGNK